MPTIQLSVIQLFAEFDECFEQPEANINFIS